VVAHGYSICHSSYGEYSCRVEGALFTVVRQIATVNLKSQNSNPRFEAENISNPGFQI
jgi:hypothetical protein